MRIEYHGIRRWVLFFLPAFLICALPDYLGITVIKPGWEAFRMYFDGLVTVCFVGGIVYALYAVVHNAGLESGYQD
jgi:hypothetical protein